MEGWEVHEEGQGTDLDTIACAWARTLQGLDSKMVSLQVPQSRVCSVIGECVETMRSAVGNTVLVVPLDPNMRAIDGVVLLRHEGRNVALLLQATVAKSHAIKGRKAVQFLTNVRRCLVQAGFDCKLAFIVPPSNFNMWSRQQVGIPGKRLDGSTGCAY